MDRLRTPGTFVFVATGFKQKADGKALMNELVEHGLTITCDWTSASGLEISEMATRDVAGVKRAQGRRSPSAPPVVTIRQVLVALMTLDNYEYKGTFTEIGIALGADIPVVIISPFTKSTEAICARNIYFHHPSIERYPTVAKFIETLQCV